MDMTRSGGEGGGENGPGKCRKAVWTANTVAVVAVLVLALSVDRSQASAIPMLSPTAPDIIADGASSAGYLPGEDNLSATRQESENFQRPRRFLAPDGGGITKRPSQSKDLYRLLRTLRSDPEVSIQQRRALELQHEIARQVAQQAAAQKHHSPLAIVKPWSYGG